MTHERRRHIATIGAGVMAICTAICLQDSDPSLHITLVEDKFSPDNTSDDGAGKLDTCAGLVEEERRQTKERIAYHFGGR